MVKRYCRLQVLMVLSVVMTAPRLMVANHLPSRLTPDVIKGLINTNMDIFEVYGVLVVPLYYRFAWTGQGADKGWTFQGYTYNKLSFFGINYEGSKLLKHWNGRLLPDSETVIVNPQRFKQYMKSAFKFNWMKKSHYKGVDYQANAYLCVRIKPREHRNSRPYR